MVELTGTTDRDRLFGTNRDDTLTGLGTSSVSDWDVLIGRNGADTYDLTRLGGGPIMRFRIDDKGTDGALDHIVNAGPMYSSASLGYSGWAHAIRTKGDDLMITLPGKPHRFRDPAKPEYKIRIVDHFEDAPVETLEAGGVVYQLAAGSIGSDLADIVAGSNHSESLSGLDGDDWLYGNGGRDQLDLGAGNDVGFGGKGADSILGGAGNDTIFGEDGSDKIWGGDGFDWIHGGEGRDRIFAGADNDWIWGDGGDDRLVAGAGDDRLDGGVGNDTLIGGKGADVYVYDAHTGANSGQDIILENGTKGSWATHDTIELRGIYGPHIYGPDPAGSAYSNLSFAKAGDDMVIQIEDGAGGMITVNNMFDAANHDKYFVEKLVLDGGYWSSIQFRFLDGQVTDIGDDRTIFLTYGADLNEVLFGTDGDDLIFGGTGTNFVWTGAGADVLIYKIGDGEGLGGLGGRISRDIVEDFDVTQDTLDFSEVKTSYANLTITEDEDGDAIISWLSGSFEDASISIELRGVSAAEVTEDIFLFV